MKVKYITLNLLFLFFFNTFSQDKLHLTDKAEISIITAGPGKEIYEAFGHSAIRINDKSIDVDYIYNYGLFDFNAPNFELNFTKGKLLYLLGKHDFYQFVASYSYQNRWLKEQVLNLTLKEKQQFYNLLEENLLPENATYLYDPFFNNCASKLRDLTKSVLKNKVDFSNKHAKQNLTIRTLMNHEIHWNTWGSFGINLALGNKLDKIATSDEYMYLPDYVYSTFKDSNRFLKNQPNNLVSKERNILNFDEIKADVFVLNPLFIFSLLAFIILIVTYKDFKANKRSNWVDNFIFISTGLIGCLIVFLWFFTDHFTTPNNFNILWAFATNLVVGFVCKKPKWFIYYIKFLLVLLLLIPVVWLSKIQQLPLSITPLILAMFIRYLYLNKHLLPLKK